MRNEKVRITLIYTSLPCVALRILTFSILSGAVIFQLYFGIFPKFPLFLLSVFLIIEIFVLFGLEHIFPRISIKDNTGDVFDSFTKEALESSLFKVDTRHFIETLIKFPQSKFFLAKAEIPQKDLEIVEIDQMDLIYKAVEITKKTNENYITTTDLLAAYLILSDSETKILFDRNLDEQDVLNIVEWAKIIFDEENPKEARARFVGIGIGETLVWGWTPETKKYTRDHTFSSIKRRSMIEGREKEYEELIQSLQKETSNNVLLIGDIGTGKTNLVENFIYESYEAKISKKLNHSRLLELMIGPFIAGSTDRGDLEIRLQSMIDEVKHSGNVVLFIPEFQNLLGSSTYNIDLSGAILPYLKDGRMPIIATMTKEEYKKFFEKNPLRDVFEVITLEEPNKETAIKMLFQKTEEIEKENRVILSYKAVLSAVKFADKYNPDGALPGSAVDLLNDVSNSVRVSKGENNVVSEEDVLQAVENKSHIPVGKPKEKERVTLLNFEEELSKKIVGQEVAVKSISEAIRRVRSGLAKEKPISFLFLGPTGVGKTHTAKTLANLYFNGEAHIIRLDMSEYGTDESMERLISSGSGGFLDNVASHPFSLILLDEFEKANDKILNLFLQVLEDGRMTDSNGKTYSFNNSIIIATSNAGSEYIRQSIINNKILANKDLLDYLQKYGIFKPELLNRFDDIVIFKPLDKAQIQQITKLMLNDFSNRLKEKNIYISFDNQVQEVIVNGGFNEQFGARPLRRFIEDSVEDQIAEKILSNEIKEGDKIVVSATPDSKILINKSVN